MYQLAVLNYTFIIVHGNIPNCSFSRVITGVTCSKHIYFSIMITWQLDYIKDT